MTQQGVFVGNRPAEVARFEGWLGEPVDAVLGFTGSQSWGDADPGWVLSSQFLGGAGRQIHWSIPAWPDSGGVAAMREAAAGRHDAKYTDWANKILASRSGDAGDIFVRTTWELGGEWFPWTGHAAQDPAAYKQAFQRFADAFHDVSPRFKVVWDFVPDRPAFGVENFYPGDAAVDVISQDVYWSPQYSGTDPVAAFARHDTGLPRGLSWASDFAAQHGKPFAISEWGVPGGSSGVDSAAFIREMEEWIEGQNAAGRPVLYADYWNSTAAYDGLLSDGQPASAAAELDRLYTEGYATGGSPSPGGGTPPGGGGSAEVGAGPDALVLKVSQDYYGPDDARYTVSVDGVQVGGALTASARHSAGQSDTVTVKGDWGAGAHGVSVDFLNDAYGGPGSDRNLWVDGATYNGAAVPGAARQISGYNDDPGTFSFTEPASGGGSPQPGPIVVGSGSDTLRLLVSQDSYQGDARFTVSIDGRQIGGVQTADSERSGPGADIFDFKASLAPGWHPVDIAFLNDAWGGTPGTDRNLYVEAGSGFNGTPFGPLPDGGWIGSGPPTRIWVEDTTAIA